MRADVLEYIYSNKELKQFIREQPQWYRQLSRDPKRLEQFEIAALHYFQKTIPHQVEKFSQGVQMANMFMGMLQAMNAK